MMRIAVITGGRDHAPGSSELAELHAVLHDFDIDLVRTGGARGVDTIVYMHLRDVINREVWRPDWPRFGTKGPLNAGHRRNLAMLTGDTSVLVAHDDTERIRTADLRACITIGFHGNSGTKNCLEASRREQIDIYQVGRARALRAAAR